MESMQSFLFHSCFKREKKDDSNILEDISCEYKYKLGVIDFLTEYNTSKKVERAWNNVVYWKERQDLSC